MLERFLKAIRIIHKRLTGTWITCVITASMGMAQQGIDIPVNDIDLQTDREGTYIIEHWQGFHLHDPYHAAQFVILQVFVESKTKIF